MIRDEVLTAEEVEGINNKNRYNINPVINKDSELLSKHILELQADKGRLTDRVKELEQKLEQTEKDLADYQFNYPTIKELQKENADLKEEINKIAFARGNLEEENAELKKRNAELKGMYTHSAREAGTYKQFLELKEKENAELKEELKKWKDEWQEQVQKATDEGYARTLQTIQLTKAKEIIKIFLKYEICTLNIKEELADNIAKAEQFISEVEK